jgi:RNA polymerase sigma-70 factor (ECF subfamily)
MSDAEIIKLIRDDGQHQLGCIYVKYRTEFLHWIQNVYNCSSDDCQDIYQMTILIFYDNVRSGKLEYLTSSIKTYLFAIGKNVAHDNLRARQKKLTLQESWPSELIIREDDPAHQDFVLEAVRQAMARMSEPSRTLLQLFYYEHKTMEEICILLGYKNAATAKNQKCKIMTQLRKLVSEEIHKMGKASEPISL